MNNIFREMYIINDYDKIKIEFNSEIKGQGVDAFGKTRYIQFENLCIFTDPIPNLLTETEYKFIPSSKENADNFIKKENIKNVLPIMINVKGSHLLVGLKARKNNVNFYIPLKKTYIKGTYPIMDEITIPVPQNNKYLAKFNEYKRISRYIIEYSIYLFSLYLDTLEDKKSLFVNNKLLTKTLINFSKEKIEINNSVEYKIVPRLFSLDRGLLSGGKLILHSEDTIKRVLYSLKLHIKNYPEETKKYYTRKYIKNYYEDVSDFTKYPDQVILSGEYSLQQYLKSVRISYKINKEIIPISIDKKIISNIFSKLTSEKEKSRKEMTPEIINQAKEEIEKQLLAEHLNQQPYFYSDKKINDYLELKSELFIVQPAQSKNHALYISDIWNKNHYNNGVSDMTVLEKREYTNLTFKDGEISIVNKVKERIVLRYSINIEDFKEPSIFYYSFLPFIM